MKKRALVKLLAAAEDHAAVQGLLKQLRIHGVRVSESKGALKKRDIVLAVLSEHFYADEGLKNQLISQLAVGADAILPLKLGEDPVPEDIMNLLFARNIIMASGRNDSELAERILAAIPERKNRLPVVLALAAVALMLLGGFLFWKNIQKPEEAPAVAEEGPIPNPWGITEEELAEIQNVVIVGDQFAYHTYDDYRVTGYWPGVYDYSYDTWEDDGRHWYSKEDGHEYLLTRYDDLRFLELMPNLSNLKMVMVEAESDMLPDLSKSQKLREVTIHDCSIGDLNWIAGSSVFSLEITNTDIRDYSALNACSFLRNAYLDNAGYGAGDLSGFAPPSMKELTISNFRADETVLSTLSDCSYLSYLRLDSLQIRDLSFLENMGTLYTLDLSNLHQLHDISALSTMEHMTSLTIRQCDQITDYMPVHNCSMLEHIHIERSRWIPVDSSFLNGLSKLYSIGLYGLNLNNMDFLKTLAGYNAMHLGFGGDIQDYSGLEHVKRYQFIHVNPRSSGMRFGDYSLVEPYLRNANITEMELYNCTNVDLSTLPSIHGKLTITGGDLEDLTGLYMEQLLQLELRDMQYLRSLKGIEALPKLSNNALQLSILGCPRLLDYTALNGGKLHSLSLVGMYSMPDFSEINLKALSLESIDGLEDLGCLETLDKNEEYRFEFLGLDDLKDLSALWEFRGYSLYVPPQVADQAEELVREGHFRSYEVRYPSSGWSPQNEEIVLLNAEELETLPGAVLKRVRRVWFAGDEIIDPNRYEVREEWQNDRLIVVVYDRQTDKTRKANPGIVTDFSKLTDLTGLVELRLFGQPITDLEGIQYCTGLRCFEAKCCDELTDISALFALQNLDEISLSYTGINSIQGVQNMSSLRHLCIRGTQVSDLSPLMDLDYTAAMELGGFGLELDDCPVEDLSVLSVIPKFSILNLCRHPVENWMDYVAQTPIQCFVGQLGNDDMLQRFVRQHPELEEMHIEEGYQLTDLTPLLELEHLSYVHIWGNGHNARRSLDGHERRFGIDAD